MTSPQSKWLVSIACAAASLYWLMASPCHGQPQEVYEGEGLQSQRPGTSIAELQKALSNVIFETKPYQDDTPFAEFTKGFGKAVSRKGKDIQVVIDRDAFRAENDDAKIHDVRGDEISMPPVPGKLVANTALRLAVAQVARGNATYWLRRGQVMITSDERAKTSYFLKSAVVAVDAKDRKLADVLDDLAEESGVTIIVDARVAKQARSKVLAKCGGKLEFVVAVLAKSAGLQAVTINNVIYITSAANAQEFKMPEIRHGCDVAGAVHKNALLTRVLDDFALRGLGWVIDSGVSDEAKTRITAKWHNYVEADVALVLVTDMAGLQHVVIDEIAYITSPANAKKLEKEKSRKKPMPD